MHNSKKTVILTITAFAVCIAALWLWITFRPLSPVITTEFLEKSFQFLPAEECAFSQWERTFREPEGELVLEIEPQELLILQFYSDGKVVVSDGYAMPVKQSGFVTYNVPQSTIEAFVQYYANNGQTTVCP